MPNSKERLTQIRAPIGIGELIDKITILEIKSERISDEAKLRNVSNELKDLRELKSIAGLDTPEMTPYEHELKTLNAALWDIEDEVRELEARKNFGARFIELARSVYLTNDRRARTKQNINIAFGSQIVEEKSYKGT
jgi:predicted  nucleic acid-binding Zn-ribbon protein